VSGVELVTDAATAALTGIDAAAKTTADAWQGHRGTIDATEAGIGTGPLAAAFRSVYLPEPAKQGADRVLAAVPAVVKAGQDGVADYVAADQRAAAGFPG
jgi:Na+/alanine symporter